MMKVELSPAGRVHYRDMKVTTGILYGWAFVGRKWVLQIEVDGEERITDWHPSWWQPATEKDNGR